MTTRASFHKWIFPALIGAAASAASTAWAAITSTGDVSPANASTWTTSTNGLIGNTSYGTVTVSGGALRSNAANLGMNAGSNGTVTVDGSGSSWSSTDGVTIGYSGNGTLNVIHGGTLATNGWDYSDFIGYNAGATGTATVSGGGSTWATGAWLYVGYGGAGTLNILSGAKVTNPNQGYLGYGTRSTGTATVDGAGSTWTNSGLYVGYYGPGILNVTNGGKVGSSSASYLGYAAGAPGTATVDGLGSVWTTSGLTVGVVAAGTLNITNNALVTVAGTTTLASSGTAPGAINFGPNGGTLTTQSLLASPAQFTGTGTVNTRGLISDVNLLFDATHGFIQTFVWNNASQQVTVNLDLSGASGAPGGVGAGYLGTGTLTIRDGVVVTGGGILGYQKGSSGIATVTGPGSKWTGAALSVGNSGSGTLNITNGGTVTGISGSNDSIGNNAGSSGTVSVDGTGSTWITGNNLYVGNSGSGVLNITNGGVVTVPKATYVAATSTAAGAINFGSNGGTLTTPMLYASPTQFTGTGTVNTSGLGGMVSDVNLVLDATHGLSQQFIWSGPNVHIAVNLDLSGASGVVGDLGAGYRGYGSLAIRDGVKVTSVSGYLGYGAGSTGTAQIDGANSAWITKSSLYVGEFGTGTLTLTNGGMVNCSASAYLAYYAGSSGVTVVNGTGSNWTVGYDVNVGYTGAGTLTITNGGSVTSAGAKAYNTINSYLGYASGSSGTATVDGAGSTWSMGGNLRVGSLGTGTLNVTHGGQVSIAGDLYIGGGAGSAMNISNGGPVTAGGMTRVATGATVGFGPGSGTLTTQSFYGVQGQLFGTGVIRTRGILTDGALVLDSSHGLSQTLNWVGSSQSITVNLDLSGASGAAGDLGAGYMGQGTLTIRDGIRVTSPNAYLGYLNGSTGIVTVQGTGSTWTNTSLYVGYWGTGVLNIINGGKVNTTAYSVIGFSNLPATVTIDGTGSVWNNAYLWSNSGTLNIINGGQMVMSYNAETGIGSGMVVAINVGDGSQLNASSAHQLGNSGIIRLRVVPGLATGTFTPITAGTWDATGTIQALGGTWNSSTHKVTVTAPSNGTSGQAVTINTYQTQRVVITDPTSGNIVQGGFQSTAATSSVSLTASLLTNYQSALLSTTLPANSAELAGWTFTASGYTTGNPVFLSLDIGPGYSTGNLAIYHFDGTTWSPYSAPDLSYDGTYANFTVTGFSGYAVTTTATPEPATLTFLALASLIFLQRRRPRLHAIIIRHWQ